MERYYKGKTIKEFCIYNDLPYDAVILTIRKNINDNPNIDPNIIISKVMQEYLQKGSLVYKYFYKGKPLVRYCEENGINYDTMKWKIRKAKKDYPEKDIDTIIQEYITSYRPNAVLYFYKNQPLREYCDKNDLNYVSVIEMIIKERKKNPEEEIQNIVDRIVPLYEKGGYKSSKYMYHGVILARYCAFNNLDYELIKKIIDKKTKDNPYKNIDLIVEEVVDVFLKNKKQIVVKPVKKAKKQEEVVQDPKKEIQENNNELRISPESMELLEKIKMPENQRELFIFFFYDGLDKLGNKTISLKRIKEIFDLVKTFKIGTNFKLEKDIIYLYNLLGIYRCCMFDTRKEFIKLKEQDILNSIYQVAAKHKMKLNRNQINDIRLKVQNKVMEMMDVINVNNPQDMNNQLNMYIDAYTSNYFREYVETKLKGRK